MAIFMALSVSLLQVKYNRYVLFDSAINVSVTQSSALIYTPPRFLAGQATSATLLYLTIPHLRIISHGMSHLHDKIKPPNP